MQWCLEEGLPGVYSDYLTVGGEEEEAGQTEGEGPVSLPPRGRVEGGVHSCHLSNHHVSSLSVQMSAECQLHASTVLEAAER